MTPQDPGSSCNINMQIDKCLDLTFWWLVIRKPRKHHQLGIAEIWKIRFSPDAVNGLWLTFGNILHVRINLLQPTLPFSYLLRIGLEQYCGHESLEMSLTKSFKMLRQNLISLYIGIWNVFPQVHRSSIFEIVWENLKSNDSYSCLSYFCGMSVNMTKSWFNQKTPYFLTAEMSHRNNVKHKQCQLTWLLLRREVENISPDKKHPGVSFRRLAVFETKRSTTFENKEK